MSEVKQSSLKLPVLSAVFSQEEIEGDFPESVFVLETTQSEFTDSKHFQLMFHHVENDRTCNMYVNLN